MSRNDDYTTGNLLNYLYHKNYYILISIDFSRETNMNIPHQIIFIGTLEENGGAKMLFFAEKQKKNNSKIFFRFINCNRII